MVINFRYSYYLLSCCGEWIKPFLWWKKYLTMLQIIQFFAIELHLLIGMVVNCPYPREFFYTGVLYLIPLIIMFANFYYKNYRKQYYVKVKGNN